MSSVSSQLSDHYLVSGVFFQGEKRSFFNGLLTSQPEIVPNLYSGQLVDEYGQSRLQNIEISEFVFTFNKWYQGRDYPISYRFTPNANRPGEWIGRYESRPTGTGSCRCILVPVLKTFFEDPNFADV